MHMNKPFTILLADDDPDDRQFFLASVTEAEPDVKCVSVEDGQQALEYLYNEDNAVPDYIFLDLRMPRMSGQQCLEKIREQHRLKTVPVIIYTTSIDADNSEELMKEGATHFITKPTNPEEIFYILSMILDQKWT